MLTKDLILQKHKNGTQLSSVKTISMWGSDIENISILSKMPNLEIVSLSVNKISSLSPLSHCLKLKELYLRRNYISSLSEINYLIPLKSLKILWLDENPICKLSNYRHYIISTLPQLAKLDNMPVNQYYNSITTNPNNISYQIDQSKNNEVTQKLRRVASSIDTTKTPKLIFNKKNFSREPKNNESFSKYNRIDSKNSFSEVSHNLINPNKSIHVRSHSSKKNVIFKKLKLKLKPSFEQEKVNHSNLKNNKVRRNIPICKIRNDFVKNIKNSENITNNLSIYNQENNNEKDFSHFLNDSKEHETNNNDQIIKKVILLVDKMKLSELLCLQKELNKKIIEKQS